MGQHKNFRVRSSNFMSEANRHVRRSIVQSCRAKGDGVGSRLHWLVGSRK